MKSVYHGNVRILLSHPSTSLKANEKKKHTHNPRHQPNLLSSALFCDLTKMSTKFEAFTGDDSADDYAAMDMEARMTGPGSTRLKATVGRRLNHKTLITALVVCGVAVAAVVLLVGACVAVAAVLIARSNRAPQYVCSNSARKGDRCVDVVNFEKGAVSSDSAECSSLGVKIMRERGGNAMDAAVAVTLCLGLVHPFSSGIGGGNVILVFRPPKDQDGDDDDDGQYSPVHVFNAREKAPLEAHRDMFNDNPKDAQLGGRAIAVPGEISGLFEAWRKFGSHLDWEEVLEDVVEMAERGVTVNHMLANKLQTHREAIMANDEFKAVFAPTGVLLREGDVIKYEKLARTLRTIMEDGAESFYDTDHRLARDIVADVNDAGGIIREEDLQQYESEVSTEPAHIRYQGLDVYGPRAPFSGGPCVLMMLSLLENFDLSRLGNGYDAVHAMVEASKFAFAHRMVLGDPEFVNTTAPIVEKMLNAKYADELRRRMPSPKEGTSADPTHYGYENKLSLTSESHGTTHLNAVDSNGMTVAITSTINLEFGSFVMGSRTGILFNNEVRKCVAE